MVCAGRRLGLLQPGGSFISVLAANLRLLRGSCAAVPVVEKKLRSVGVSRNCPGPALPMGWAFVTILLLWV